VPAASPGASTPGAECRDTRRALPSYRLATRTFAVDVVRTPDLAVERLRALPPDGQAYDLVITNFGSAGTTRANRSSSDVSPPPPTPAEAAAAFPVQLFTAAAAARTGNGAPVGAGFTTAAAAGTASAATSAAALPPPQPQFEEILTRMRASAPPELWPPMLTFTTRERLAERRAHALRRGAFECVCDYEGLVTVIERLFGAAPGKYVGSGGL
jgi:hypothetical protein